LIKSRKLLAAFLVAFVFLNFVGEVFSDELPAEKWITTCIGVAAPGEDCPKVRLENNAENRKFIERKQKRRAARDLNGENRRVFKIGNKEYTKDQLVQDFMRVAFPRYLWVEDMPLSEGRFYTSPVYNPYSQSDTEFPPNWIKEYIQRKKGFPDFGGVNRWAGDEITVGIGLPPIPVEQPVHGELQDRVKNIVSTFVPSVKAATGKVLRFITPNEETKDHYAGLRIILDDTFYIDNKFKSQRLYSRFPPYHTPFTYGYYSSFELDLIGAVRFTPMARSQVDGYFIPDERNRIRMAVCRIWPDHQGDLFASLVTECIVRALGLPEVSLWDQRAALGTWNSVYDPISKRSVLDGPDVNDGLRKRVDSAQTAEEKKVMTDIVRQSFVQGLLKKEDAVLSLTEYDAAILKMLYCEKIEPGMGRYEILNVFYQSNDCFSF